MQIPKRVRVGKTTYTVLAPDKMERQLVRGNVHYSTGVIKVALRDNMTGKPLSDRARTHTFWHEITHAVLKDMGHRLESNEGFVDKFAKRLTDVVKSARF